MPGLGPRDAVVLYMGMASIVHAPQVVFSPLPMTLAMVTVLATAAGAMISVPALLSALIMSASKWSPWISVIKIRSAGGSPVNTAGLAGSMMMTFPPASISSDAWYTAVIFTGPADVSNV